MPALSVKAENITKHMGRTLALDAVSAVFDAGKVHGVIGPNGAGKTTLMRIAAGLLRPEAGAAEYYCEGEKISAERAKAVLGYFPQEPSLYPDLSCMEHLEFFRDLYSIKQKDFLPRAEELFNATGMAPFKARPAGKLSGGMYKKLGLMCVLLNRPRLLLLDEPTIGVDPVSRQQLWDLVYKYAGADMTVIVNTSYMDEARRCYKVHILEKGRMLASGAPEALMQEFKVNNFADIFLHDDK